MKLINGNGTAAEWARPFASQAELRFGVRIPAATDLSR